VIEISSFLAREFSGDDEGGGMICVPSVATASFWFAKLLLATVSRLQSRAFRLCS
jgi:hypothetical protein